MTSRSARPLGEWMAVQPFKDEVSKWIEEPFKRGIKFRRGRVLRGGPMAPLPDGTIVWYEAHSAHPGQTSPLPAEWFGGDEGEWAFLVRAPIKAVASSEAADKEIEGVEKDIDRLRKDWQGVPEETIPREVRSQMTRLVRRQEGLEAARAGMRRSRRVGHTTDTAVRAGIFAVEEPEPEYVLSEAEDLFYRDFTPRPVR